MSETHDSSKPLSHNDAAILKHMEIHQDIISRMANNCPVCKNWCIALVSAFLACISIHWNIITRENLVWP